MSTVNTTQTPDLLLSMLMGMVGSATPTPANAAGDPGGMLFAALLDDSLEQSAPAGTFPDLGSEKDPETDAAGGELSALIAAALGTGSGLARQPVSHAVVEESESSSKLNSTSAFTGSSSASLELSRSGQTGNPSNAFGPLAGDRDGFFNAARTELLGPELAFGTDATGQKAPIKTAAAGIDWELAKDSTASAVDATKPAARNELTEPRAAATASAGFMTDAPDVNVTPESNGEVDADSAVTASNESVGIKPESAKENSSNRIAKNRGLKSAGHDAEAALLGGITTGSFGGLEESPLVTAISGGGQTRQDGILGRPAADEPFASTITARDSSSGSPQFNNLEAGQQPDLNAARADFEQALDRVAENFPLDSVAQQIVEVAEPDSGWISVEIQPPNLGKLEIMVSKQGDEYSAQIIAHESSTQEALNLQQAELLEALNQHGLELKEVQIVSDSDSGNRWNFDGSRQDSQDEQARRELSGEGRDADRRGSNFRTSSNQAPVVVTHAAGRQQINFLV